MGVVLASLAAASLASAPSAASLGLRPAYSLTQPAAPSPPATRRPGPGKGPRERLLELWVDGKNRNVVARVREDQGQLFVANADLAAAGLADAGGDADAMTPLSALGLTGAQVLAGPQQLLLTTQAGPDRQVLDLRGSRAFVTPRSDTGFVLRYDLSALLGESFGGWSAAAAMTGSVFTPRGRLDASGWVRADEETSRFTRLDTSVELNDAERMRRLTLGDSLSSQLAWSRSVRFAGVQLARDFSLQPDRLTLPGLDFLGRASAPSSVDVFVNAARVYTGQVDTGPFEVRDIPLVTGRGEAVVVVRDMLGRAVSTTLPLYASGELLAAGLTDYSLEAGALRRGYGVESFAYGAPLVMASVRRGVNDRLTAQAHLEASPRVALAGAGASVLLGSAGIASASLAASDGEAGGGLLYAVSFESDLDRLRLFGAAAATSGDYQDIAAAYEGFAVPDRSLRLGAAFEIGRRGSLGASWISERGGGRNVELATASYSWSPRGGWYLGASGLYDASQEAWAGQLFLRVPLTGALSAAASTNLAPGRQTTSVTLNRRADPDGGWGYALTAAPDEQRLQAEAVWYGAKAGGSAAVLSDDGELTARILASGALVGMDGAVFASRGVEGALALVKTGAPGVQVYRENRPVAVTDAHGRVLLAGLTPNARNRIGVKLTDFPFTAELEAPEREVAPGRRSGVIIDFTPAPSRPALLVIRLADGAFPPAGSLLDLGGGEQVVVGRRGEAFIRDLNGPLEGSVRYGQHACRIAAAPPPTGPGDDIPRIAAACLESGA